MSDLPEFLLACFAEDDDAARRAAFGYGAGWTSVSDDVDDWSTVHAVGKRDMVGCEDRDVTRHIARHDPAHELRVCEAHRRIVESCRVDYEDSLASGDDTTSLAEEVLQALALPYADRPGFREEWKP